VSTAGTRYVNPFQQIFINGAVAPGALVEFYLTNSTTPAITYSDYGLTVPNADPVVADGNGNLPSIFLDPAITYKVVITDSTGANSVTADPVSSWVAAITAGLNLGTAAPANLGTSGGTLGLLNSNLTFSGGNTSSGYWSFTGGGGITPQAAPNAADIGYMGFPQNAATAPYTVAMTDLGKDIIVAATGTITLPANATTAVKPGQWTLITAGVGAVVTLAIGGTDTLRWPVGNLTGSRTITGPGFALVHKKFTTEWWLTGGMTVS